MTSRTYRALSGHMLKVWVFAILAMIPFWLISPYIPRWLFLALFFLFGLFVFLPAVFGVGPIGRILGRSLNEAAIEDARAEREGLGGESDDRKGRMRSGDVSVSGKSPDA